MNPPANGPRRGPDPSDSDLDLVEWVRLQPGGFASAPDIASRASTGEKQTKNRLNQLVEKGLLNKRKVGGTNVYWVSDAGETALSE